MQLGDVMYDLQILGLLDIFNVFIIHQLFGNRIASLIIEIIRVLRVNRYASIKILNGFFLKSQPPFDNT